MQSHSHRPSVTRPHSFLAAVAFAVMSVAIAGCHVGSAEPTGGGSGTPDASSPTPTVDSGGTAGGEDSGGGGGSGEPPTECVDIAATIPPGHHTTSYDYEVGMGQGCMGMCHNGTNPAGGIWTVAGVLYEELGDSDPIGGARVWVTDQQGKSVEMITADNGEFFTQEALEFPVTTFATGCPERIPMSAPAAGNCNASTGCHGQAFRINLPL